MSSNDARGFLAGLDSPTRRFGHAVRKQLDRLRREVDEITSGSSTVDHGALLGKSDDDHGQYALANGTRGNFEVAGAVTTHAAEGNPHPIYLTAAEGDAAYDAAGSAAIVDAALDAHVVDAVDAHASSAIGYDGSGNSALIQAWLTSSELHGAITDLAAQLYAPSAEETQALIDALNALVVGSPLSNGDVLASNLIAANHIASGSVTTVKLGAQAVTAAKITTGTITATQLASNSITTVKLNANAVTAAKIATGTITANEILANTITTAKLAVDAIKSPNYTYTSGDFSDLGSSFNLSNGTLITPGLFVNGVSPFNVSFRGDVAAESFQIVDGSDIVAEWGTGTTFGYAADGFLRLSPDTSFAVSPAPSASLFIGVDAGGSTWAGGRVGLFTANEAGDGEASRSYNDYRADIDGVGGSIAALVAEHTRYSPTGDGVARASTVTAFSGRANTDQYVYIQPRLRVPAGVATAPTYSFDGDTDTGVFLATSNSVGFAAAGAIVGEFNTNGLKMPNTGYGGHVMTLGHTSFTGYGGLNGDKGYVIVDHATDPVMYVRARATLHLGGYDQNAIICGNAATYLPYVYTSATASAANVHVASSGLLSRSTSSLRYKTDVEDIDPTLARNIIANSRPVWFRSLADGDIAEHSHYGLIAEEVDLVDKRLVAYEETDDGPIPGGVQYDRYVPALISVIHQLTARIEALEAR